MIVFKNCYIVSRWRKLLLLRYHLFHPSVYNYTLVLMYIHKWTNERKQTNIYCESLWMMNWDNCSISVVVLPRNISVLKKNLLLILLLPLQSPWRKRRHWAIIFCIVIVIITVMVRTKISFIINNSTTTSSSNPWNSQNSNYINDNFSG